MSPAGDVIDYPGASTPQKRGGPGNGNGHDLHGRVSKLEGQLGHLATKADVESIKRWALKGAIIGMVTAASLAIAILKPIGG